MRRSSKLQALVSAVLLPVAANAAAGSNTAGGSARPIVLSLNHPGASHARPGAPQLPQWNGSFTDRTGRPVSFTMVGGDPAKTGTTHVSVVLVPLFVWYEHAGRHIKVFDPRKHKVSNGQTVMENTVNSPLFTANIDYIQGGTDLGATQFIDAFQRGNFWRAVKENPDYRLAYDVTVGEALKIRATAFGKVIENPLGGGTVGTMDFESFDMFAQHYIQSYPDRIDPSLIPLFVSYNVFLTEGGACCIGGYHAALGGAPGGQAYAFATYVDAKKSFAEDVSAVALELAGVTDDPFLSNRVNCAGIPALDPGATVGLKHVYPYTENDFTYRLPSLDFVTYFGAPKSTSVNRWYSFQGEQRHACKGQ